MVLAGILHSLVSSQVPNYWEDLINQWANSVSILAKLYSLSFSHHQFNLLASLGLTDKHTIILWWEWSRATMRTAQNHFPKQDLLFSLQPTIHPPIGCLTCTVRMHILIWFTKQEMNKTFLMNSSFSGWCFCKIITAHFSRCYEKDFFKLHRKLVKWMTH